MEHSYLVLVTSVVKDTASSRLNRVFASIQTRHVDHEGRINVRSYGGETIYRKL